MNNFGKRNYFNIIFSIVFVLLSFFAIAGQAIFLSIGLTAGISNWDLEGILVIGVAIFGGFIIVCLCAVIFFGFTYWAIDNDGIINGGIFKKRKILFSEVDKFEIKAKQLPSLGGVWTTDCLFFYNKKKYVVIPLYCLNDANIEWLKNQINVMK